MGEKWSICARNVDDKLWEVCDEIPSVFEWIFKSIYCLIKYDIVIISKH